MSDDFEKQLRQTLEPVDPPPGFADRVMSRIEQQPVRLRRQVFRWLPVALAASLILAVVVVQDWQMRREAQGLEARRQLIEALRVTGQKLDVAYQAVNRESHRPTDGSGA